MNGFRGKKRGYTIIEVLVVVTIIGILSALGYASLTDAIQMSRAKDNARNMTAFVERALMDGKRKNIDICIKCSGGKMSSHKENCDGTQINNFELLGGFEANNNKNPMSGTASNFNNGRQTGWNIGLSTVKQRGYFVVSKGNYLAATVKENNNNHFTARISKDNGSTWEDLK